METDSLVKYYVVINPALTPGQIGTSLARSRLQYRQRLRGLGFAIVWSNDQNAWCAVFDSEAEAVIFKLTYL